MFVTYTPGKGTPNEQEPMRWTFDPDRISARASIWIENHSGMSYSEWRGGIVLGNTNARHTLLTHLLRLDHPRAVEPDWLVGELEITQSVAEWQAMRSMVEKNRSIPDTKREIVLAGIDQEIREAMEREGVVDSTVVEGKALGS